MGPLDRDEEGGPAPARCVWRTPRVIEETVADTKLGDGTFVDGAISSIPVPS